MGVDAVDDGDDEQEGEKRRRGGMDDPLSIFMRGSGIGRWVSCKDGCGSSIL
jgi:hypothetical protein